MIEYKYFDDLDLQEKIMVDDHIHKLAINGDIKHPRELVYYISKIGVISKPIPSVKELIYEHATY
jgi:two-component SAPR family response regulator